MIVEIRLEDPENISHPVSGLGDCFLKAVESLQAAGRKVKAELPPGWENEAYALYAKLSPSCCSLEADLADSSMTMEVYRICVKIRYRYLDLPRAENQHYPVSSNRYAALEPQEVYCE